MRPLFNKYQVWLVHTPSEANLFLWNQWKLLFPLVDRLVSLSPAKAAIRSHQAMDGIQGWLGFGRMAWNKENNEKWTTRYRQNEGSCAVVRFFDTQVWAPDWNHTDRTGLLPDLFIRLFNEPRSHISREGLVVAVKTSIARAHAATIESIMTDIADRVQGSTVSSMTRSWFPGAGFAYQIQDMNPGELDRLATGVTKPSTAGLILLFLKGKKTDP